MVKIVSSSFPTAEVIIIGWSLLASSLLSSLFMGLCEPCANLARYTFHQEASEKDE